MKSKSNSPYPELTLKPEDIPLDVIYEDDAILVVNKAPEWSSIPQPGIGRHFVNALLFHCRQAIENLQQAVSPALAQRPALSIVWIRGHQDYC